LLDRFDVHGGQASRGHEGLGALELPLGLLDAAPLVVEVAEVSLDLAIENLEAEQARFDVGRATNFDVLERLDAIDTAAAAALNAQIAYLKALAQLQALNGEILPAYGLAPSN
jgi:outer membrane protein TolC